MSKCDLHFLNKMQVAFAQSNLAGRAKTWSLGLKLHDPYVCGSLEVFKPLLRQTFEPPRAEFRARCELLRIKQGKRGVHSYIQYIRHLTSCITVDPLNPQTLITLFMQGLTDGLLKPTYSDWGVQQPGRGNKGCGNGRLQRESGSREFEFLSSVETTGKWRPRTNGPL